MVQVHGGMTPSVLSLAPCYLYLPDLSGGGFPRSNRLVSTAIARYGGGKQDEILVTKTGPVPDCRAQQAMEGSLNEEDLR